MNQTEDLLSAVINRENLAQAWKRVKANRGAQGIDGITVKDFPAHARAHWPAQRQQIQGGQYKPSAVRRVEIPKPDGSKRLLGIPTVTDRVIQQSIAQVLTPIYEPKFSDSSFGFRPGRNAHQAIRQVQAHVKAGRKIAVDIDLAKFFDTVNHDVLMSLLSQDIHDKRLLKLIGNYRPPPSRRVYVDKADGRTRPLGIAALEDKIVQSAVVEVINAIYEPAFMGCSHGFRPGRNPHQALDALAYGIRCRPVSWIINADIASFFDTVSHDWLQRFLEHRIADRRLLRLIKLWQKIGIMEAGLHLTSEEGTPQGAVISPVLANIYLHYVFDLWVHRWRQQHARGAVILVRYADDIVVGFERSDRVFHPRLLQPD